MKGQQGGRYDISCAKNSQFDSSWKLGIVPFFGKKYKFELKRACAFTFYARSHTVLIMVGGGDGWRINKNKKVARTQLRGVPGWLHGEGYNGYGLIPPPLG